MPMPRCDMGIAPFEDRMRMNESEWQNCEDPWRMPEHLKERATTAQRRLFGLLPPRLGSRSRLKMQGRV
jgi:hypothetical protein